MTRRPDQRPHRRNKPFHAPPRFPRLCGEPLEDRTLLTLTPQLIADINTAPAPVAITSSSQIVEVAGVAFYSARGSVLTGDELWKSDGTAAGTVLVKDIFPGG